MTQTDPWTQRDISSKARFAVPSLLGTLFLLSWLPANGTLQLLAYTLVPATIIIAIATQRVMLSRIGVYLLYAGLVLTILSLALAGDQLRPINSLLALLTYGGTLLLVVRLSGPELEFERLVPLVAFTTMIQTIIASGQFLVANQALAFQAMDAGDAAVGTLFTNSHLFAVKMLCSGLFLAVAAVVGVRRRVAMMGSGFAIAGAILGSALMATVLIFSGVLLAIIAIPNWMLPALARALFSRVRRAAIVVVGVAAVFMISSQPQNVVYLLRTISAVPSEIASSGTNTSQGKLIAGSKSAKLLSENPKVFALGAGLGHYSSRAALILSGGYLRNHPEFIPVSMSAYTKENIYPLWNQSVWTRRYHDGVLNQPFFGIQSMLVEGGALGAILLLVGYLWLWRTVLSIRTPTRTASGIQILTILFLCVLPFVLLSENWLEYPHASVQLLLPFVLATSLSGQRSAGTRMASLRSHGINPRGQ